MEYLNMSLLQIYQWVCQWKNFENRLTFGEVMGKSLVSCFFWDTVYITPPPHHTRLTALFPGLPGWAGTRKVKPIWILLKQETVSGSGISWAICKSAPQSREITMPAPHHSVIQRPDALPATQPTASKHWRPLLYHTYFLIHKVYASSYKTYE